jgi:hypothetical protein
MGEVQGRHAQLSFNRSIRIGGGDERLSSMGGTLLLREVDERLGVTRRLSAALSDPRCPGRVTWTLATQLRARLYALAAGYGAQRDVAALASDPALRLSSSARRGVAPLAHGLMSQPTLARLQRLLGQDQNLRALQRSVLELGLAVIRAAGATRGAHTLDVDSMPVMSHGQQPGSVWNDYYRGRCFHPLLAMHGETGTMLGAELRSGNVPSAKGARRFLLEQIESFERGLGQRVGCVRGDSSFASGALLQALEKRGTHYVFRLPSNPLLGKLAAPYLVAPKDERPAQPREWLHSLSYSSRRWPKRRRVILVVQETPGELYLHHFFLVTSDKTSSPEAILEHYRQRGTSEARFGEFKSRLEPKLSCTSQHEAGAEAAWRANASTFQLYLLADGLLHALRWITRQKLSTDGRSLPKLARVQRWIVDVALRVTVSARRVHMHVADSAYSLWAWALTRMGRLRPVT